MVEAVRHDSLAVIRQLSDIPRFDSEAQEAEFWQTHRLSDELLDKMEPAHDANLPPARTKPVSLRLDDHTISRAKTLAERRGTGYQTLIKAFILERLYEEEKREGLVG